MTRYLRPGITQAAENARPGQIVGLQHEVTAMVGRTLRGPVNAPVEIENFGQFKRIFGGLWERSVLPHCVAQYFDNGGERAVIVRVTNAARAATLALPADEEPLVLRAVNPGRHECMRAAVDYDGIGRDAPLRFNLTLQRVRDYHSEEVGDQEIFTDVGLDPSAPRYVGDALASSCIANLASVSSSRPQATRRMTQAGVAHYRYAGLDGDDGAPLTDADVLGSSTLHSGLFALTHTSFFTQLYLPPLGFDEDLGVAVLRAAARLCARRDALLICDARREWRSVADATFGAERLSLRSASAAMYFPRYWVGDDRSSRLVPPGAAVAGVLARVSREKGPDSAPAGRRATIRNVRALAVRTTEAQSSRLAELGVNCLRRGPGGRRVIWDARTLVAADAINCQSLRVRRLGLYLSRSIRYALMRSALPIKCAGVAGYVAAQVEQFLHREFVAGRFRGATPGSAYFARCVPGANESRDGQGTSVIIDYGFAPLTPGSFVTAKLSLRVECELDSERVAATEASG